MSHIKIFTYFIKLPDGVKEAVLACADGYTIYIEETLDDNQRKKAFVHAMKHIGQNDFYKGNVQTIETENRKE